MKRRSNRINVALACFTGLICFSVGAGCRNTTNTPISPLGTATPLSPLAPVQGSASLSPIQPASGVSTFGAPTRVPPPPTGSYRSPTAYGTTSNYLQPTAGLQGGFNQFANSGQATFGNGSQPTGALTSTGGRTMGVTELNPVDQSAIRQTSWVGTQSAQGPSIRVAPSGLSPMQPARSKSGGAMPAIDLTRQPFPPGYVPPQNRPASNAIPGTVPFPNASSSPTFAPAPMGNPSVTTASNVPTNAPPWQTSVSAASQSVAGGGSFGRSFDDNAGSLPTTGPVRTASQSNEAQWRTPSPRF
ncbi:MAG: hypothetical protein AAF802_08315 [Planctomycetota bacterium]